MKGLDPAVQHFGKTRIFGNIGHLQTAFPEDARGAARGEDLNSQGRKLPREFKDPFFIGYTDERSFYYSH